MVIFGNVSNSKEHEKSRQIIFKGQNTSVTRGGVISHIPYALKGQKLLAQGSALGFRINTTKSP